MAQTAVEWLVNKLKESGIPLMKDELEMIQQAKQMEKEQHYNTWLTAQMNYPNEDYIGISKTFEHYYNETYGNESV